MIHIKLIIMAIVWAGGFIAGKQVAYDAGPFTIAFLRFFLATLIMAGIVFKTRSFVKIDLRLFLDALAASFMGVFCYNYFFFTGIKYVEASTASVIVGMIPIFVALLSWGLLKERISIKRFSGILLSVMGALVVITKGEWHIIVHQTIGRGEIYLLLCALCAAVFALFSKRVLNKLDPVVAMVYISGLGSACMFVPAVIEWSTQPHHVLSNNFIGNLLYLTVGPSVIAVIFYYEAIKIVGATRASQYINLTPVFAVVLAMIFLDEQLTASLVVGGAMVLSGLYLTNMLPKHKPKTA